MPGDYPHGGRADQIMGRAQALFRSCPLLCSVVAPSAAVLILAAVPWLAFVVVSTRYSRCLLPLAGLVAIMLMYHVISQFLWTDILARRVAIASAAAKKGNLCRFWLLIWYATWLLSIPIWLLAGIVSWVFIARILETNVLLCGFCGLLLGVALMTVNIGWHRMIERRPSAKGNSLAYAQSLGPGSHTFDLAPWLLEKLCGWGSRIQRAYALARLLGFLAGYQVVFHFCVSLARIDVCSNSVECLSQSALMHATRFDQAMLTLNLLAAIMGVGLIRMHAVQQLAIALVDEQATRELRPTSDASVMFFAVYYSALVASAFVPTILFLHADWKEFIRNHAGPALEMAIKQSHLLTFRPLSIEPFAAIAAPILTGAMSVALGKYIRRQGETDDGS